MAIKRTRIVATIGPASCKPVMLSTLIKNGLNVARLNFSHGTFEEHAKYIGAIRSAARHAGKTISILQDLSGPKIRVGALPPEGVKLVVGEKIFLSNNPRRKDAISFSYPGLAKDVRKGDRILFDDGNLEIEVLATTLTEIAARVIVGGTLLSHKGINVTGASLKIPAITEKDKKDLIFGLAHGVDFVALSFVRNPRDIEQLRKLIAKEKPQHVPKIIAKIEKHEAVESLEAIIHAADGIMIARGDLGVELPPEDVPLIQKRIIRLCRAAHKPVIVATQMLESMTHAPRPTRAEVSDVAHAVFDGTDAVMLSGETAAGEYPAETVTMMSRIIVAAENPEQQFEGTISYSTDPQNKDEILGQLGVIAADLDRAAAIIVSHKNIELVPILSHFRPRAALFVQVTTEHEAAQLNLFFAAYPFRVRALSQAHLIRSITREAEKMKLLSKKDRVVILEKSVREPYFSLREIDAR